MRIIPMGPNAGVEIAGVDVKRLDGEAFAPIHRAWLDYGVAVVREQELRIEDFLRYSRGFGHVVPHPFKSTRHPDHPEITVPGIGEFDADGKLNEAEPLIREGALAGARVAAI